MNKTKILGLILIGFCIGIACGSAISTSSSSSTTKTDDAGDTSTTLKILASNVLFGTSASASVSDTAVDATTKVIAENVMLDNDAVNRLNSENLQDALDDELATDVDNIIIGTWTIANYGTLGSFGGSCSNERSHSSTGTITFSENDSFSLTEGYLAAPGIGESENQVGSTCYSCGGETNAYISNQSYQIIEDSFITFSFTRDSACGLSTSYSGLALITEATSSKIILYTNDKVAVLTKSE